MWAAYCGHAKVVRFLLECGAHIDQVRAPAPPVHIPLSIHRLNLPPIIPKPTHPQTEEGKGRTALYLASGRGHAEVVKLLLSRGANPTIKRKGGWCSLSVAASQVIVSAP